MIQYERTVIKRQQARLTNGSFEHDTNEISYRAIATNKQNE